MRTLSLGSFLSLASILGGIACGGSPSATPQHDGGGDLDTGFVQSAHRDAEVADGGSGGGHDARVVSMIDGGAPDGTTSVDASSDAPIPVTDGAHPPQPQVITLGGPVLTAPKVQPIVYTEDPLAMDVEAMMAELASTATWAAATSEYGVGALIVLPAISIAGTPPATLNDNGNPSPFQQTLVTQLSGTTPAWGAPDSSTIYAFLLPSGTNIESGGSCCTDYLGYHYEIPVGSTSVPYAIVCDCGVVSGYPLTALQWVTTTVSHELEEAASDPFPDSNPAYVQSDNDDLVWTFATGGEIADMCEDNSDSNYIPPGATYMVQRSWSNAAATAGTNPCVPVPPTGPFFNSMPVFPGLVTADYYGQSEQTLGIQVPVGASKTIDLQLYSEAPTAGPWTITVFDLAEYTGTGAAQNQVTVNRSTGTSGDVLQLTIEALTAAPYGGGFVVLSTLGAQQNMSMGTVTN